jgi:hypothetical protein
VTGRRTTLEFDVARDQWGAFLREFSHDHRSWLASVERCDASGSSDVLVRERPLVGVTVDEPCVGPATAIHIALRGEQSEAADDVEVADPIAIRLVEAPGRVPSLEIHQEGNQYTRLRFRDVPLPELLDGIAPGEVEPLDSAG